MKFILGRKLDMGQIWRGDDEVVAVTRVKVDPCVITQVKNIEKDGYTAVQVGTTGKKEKNIKKPQIGHLKDLDKMGTLKEFRVEDAGELKRGDKIDLNTFEVGDQVQVTAISKGKGFQGVVKRHGFGGQMKTHGTKDQVRMPGSIGATGPAHVFKGTRMPGRMGGDQVTIKNLEIIEIDFENNILSIKGAVPGARNGLVLIAGEGELKLKVESKKEKVEKNKDVEEVKEVKETVEEEVKIEEKVEEAKEEKKAEEKVEEKKEEDKK